MEKKDFSNHSIPLSPKLLLPKIKNHHLQLVIAQVTSPRKINPRKNLLLTRLQPAFPTGISLGANVLRQVSNILRYVCCTSFMITQMPPRKTFYNFWGTWSPACPVNFQDVCSAAMQGSIIIFGLFPAMAPSQRHAVHISSRLTRKSGARALTPAPLFHYFLMPARSC